MSPVWLDKNGDPKPRSSIYPNNEIVYQNSVILLQNGKCFSATEGFINIMEITNITTLGDTTGGGSGNPENYNLPYGFTIHISTSAQLNCNGEYIEWNGISPDILIPQKYSDIKAGKDKQLEKAIKILISN